MSRLHASRRRGVTASFALVAAALGVAGCDPCTGIVGCEGGPRISYSGRVIDDKTGQGVSGVDLAFTRTSGVALQVDRATARTDADGFYRFSADAREAGTVVGTLAVRPAGPESGYEVPALTLQTSDTRGAGGVLPTWLLQPRISFIGELQDLRGGGYVTYGTVIFVRTGGARLQDDRVVSSIDPTGRFYMSMPAIDAGDAIGTLIVANSSLPREYQFATTIPVLANDRLPQLDRIWAVGTSLYFNGVLRYAGGTRPVVGAQVELRQTGGIALQPGRNTATTNADGVFTMAPLPASETPGEVIGDFVVRVTGVATPFVIPNVRIPTLDYEPPMSRRIGEFTIPLAPPAASGTP